MVEVRPGHPLADLATVSLADEAGALVEIDFEAATGSFAGFRLQSYHEVGQQQAPSSQPEVPGVPVLCEPSRPMKLSIPRLVCSKHMTAIDRGNLMINWSSALNFDQTSILPLKSGTGFFQGGLRAYYQQGQLVAFRLEDVPITLFNELPHFSSHGR